MVMHEYFWWTENVGEFLFSFYKIKSIGALVGTCFFLSVLAFLYEFLKLLQVKIRRRQLLRTKKHIMNLIENSENEGLLTRAITEQGPRREKLKVISKREKLEDFFIELCMFLGSLNLNYILMLAVMIYNGWMFISVLIGGTLGFFIFGQMFVKINLENCKILHDTFCIKICEKPDTSEEISERKFKLALQ